MREEKSFKKEKKNFLGSFGSVARESCFNDCSKGCPDNLATTPRKAEPLYNL